MKSAKYETIKWLFSILMTSFLVQGNVVKQFSEIFKNLRPLDFDI